MLLSLAVTCMPKDGRQELHERHAVMMRQVRQAFATKRKMVRNSLQPLYSASHITSAIEKAQLNFDLRPQQLSFDDYVKLYDALGKVVTSASEDMDSL